MRQTTRSAPCNNPGLFRAIPALQATVFLLSPLLALAQASDATGGILPNIDVTGKGWQQISNGNEMLEFLVALIEVAVMTAAMAYHPVRLASRRTMKDFDQPQIFFMFSLIGMVVGFLVMHHGYLIGFVIFGLGGFLRFRSDTGMTNDKALLILVTLVGLTIGLDLPVMALIITVAGWVIVYVLGTQRYFELEVRFEDDSASGKALDELIRFLGDHGFKCVSMSKEKFKAPTRCILQATNGATRESLMREMSVVHSSKQYGAFEWHVD